MEWIIESYDRRRMIPAQQPIHCVAPSCPFGPNFFQAIGLADMKDDNQPVACIQDTIG